tara:strand:+ start:1631 stop:1960 length:330 start_codon:yes stop_codon:yes gene_type:complete
MPSENPHYGERRVQSSRLNECKKAFNQVKGEFNAAVNRAFLELVDKVVGIAKTGERSATLDISAVNSDMRKALIERFSHEGFKCNWAQEFDQRNGSYDSSTKIKVEGWA